MAPSADYDPAGGGPRKHAPCGWSFARIAADYATRQPLGPGSRRLPFVKDLMAPAHGVCEKFGSVSRETPVMSFESLQNLIAVALGFAVAGVFATGYQLFTQKLPSFSQLNTGVSMHSLASVPVLAFAAPFLIMRNTIHTAIRDGRRFEFVFMATLLAGFWSLMSGMIVGSTFRGMGILVA